MSTSLDAAASGSSVEGVARQLRILETALANTVDFNYVFDLQGRFIFINRALLDLWGKTAEEALGRNFFELDYPPELAARLQRQVQEVIATKQSLRDETPYTSAVAGTRAYEYIFAPAFDAEGRVEAVAGSTRDITDRKLAAEKLRDAQARLAATMAAAAVGTWVWNVPEDRVFADASLAEMFLVSPAEAEGGGIAHYLAAIHPDDLARVRAIIAESVRQGVQYETEYRLRLRDGGWRWVNSRGNVEHDDAGKVARFNGAVIDITARKHGEEALAAQAATLRDADRRKDEFLAMLAHELRNPLASVSSAVTVLKESNDAENHAWAADVIGRQSAQLARLVDDLLDVSRITRGRIELRRELLDVARIIASAIEAVAPLMTERSHAQVVEVPTGLLWVEADPTRLEQIIVNLLTNAAKYTPPHGKITLRAREEKIPGGDATDVVISVQDNGIGIAPGQIPLMFELFAQGERSAARREGGLGIGLTVVRALCEMHGGTVEAFSEGPGTGTTFTVRLPAAPDALSPSAPQAVAVAIGEGAGRRLLLVDDNRDTATGLGRLLTRRGYEVHLAHQGPEALELARRLAPGIVLLDIGLPGMDGYEVARRLRSDASGAKALIVAISGYGQEEDRVRSREAGFDHHLVKPVDFEELRDILTADR
ncbi:MAG: ATP-binding protein [Chthoniobacter sp.]|uniref:hybrid sensor histidine kinase/response regulator n=1 Tax=Chthoniobacter sp. TaxID=2510640 RepID=UPI0032A811A1